jgi:hypothetical protein
MAGHAAGKRGMRDVHKNLAGKSEGRLICRCKDNIKMVLRR